MPKKFFYIKIEIKNSKLSLWLKNKKIIDNIDIKYWKKYYNYFKTGVYLQGEGCAKILVDMLNTGYK
jgi:hypothetical protein